MTTTERPTTEAGFLLRKLFDHLDADAMLQRERKQARDPMRPPRGDGMVCITLALWEDWLRPRMAAAIEAEARALPAEPTAPTLDVERLGRSLHLAGIGCTTEICEPTPAFYVGVSKTMHETDARDLAAEYAAAAPDGEDR
jgi:hypothetical protein